MNEHRRLRGRPKQLDEAALLAAVLGVFWSKGYSGTSLEDLASAAGVSRPSLYAALGDKRSMYLRSLEHFMAGLQTELTASLSRDKPLAAGLRRFFDRSIDLYFSSDQQRGCLVMCTAPAEALEQQAVREILRQVTDLLDRTFQVRFTASRPTRDCSTTKDPVAYARLATAALQSLALRARAGMPIEDLREFARSTADLLASDE